MNLKIDIMKTYETLEIELKEKQDILKRKETEVFTHILSLLKLNYPCVEKVRVSYRGIIIYIENGERFGHEIKIDNDCNWNDKDIFIPTLSWFGTQVKTENVSYLNYLEVLGYIAKEMKYSDSPLFKIFNDAVISIGKLEEDVNIVWCKINSHAEDATRKKELKKKENFFNNLKDGNYYINRDVGRVYTHYSFIKIIKVNPKTISYIHCDGARDYTINSLENNTFQYKRMSLDDVYNSLSSYELSTIDDVKECVESHLGEIEARYNQNA